MVTSSQKSILLVEDTAPLAMIYEEYLQAEGFKVVTCSTGQQALDLLATTQPAALVLDLLLPDMNGMQVLEQTHALSPDLPIIVATVSNSIDIAVGAMRRGAYDYIVKPFTAERLITTIRHALEHKALLSEVAEWRQMVGQSQYFNFVGQSAPMQAVYRVIDSVAQSKASVFLQGENGTGKELAAEAIHRASLRRDKPFIAINCAAIPYDLMESLIFGHVKGAFTGAIQDQPGAAKRAHGGTLFLDEICEMPLDMQAKFLRFAQTGEITPIGGNKSEIVDVRLIAATNRNPLEEVAHHRFREDLYYRLHVVPIELPPLRERGDDIVMLANHFLTRFSREDGKNFTSLSPEVTTLFRRYDWPGNVRQLENVLHNIVVLHNGTLVTEDMLPKDLRSFIEKNPESPLSSNGIKEVIGTDIKNDLVQPLWLVEKNTILHALELTRQDVTRAAAMLEVSPSTLYRKLQAWKDSSVQKISS